VLLERAERCSSIQQVTFRQAPEAPFDAVIFTRALHHMSDLQQTIVTVKQLLKPEGRIICQDYTSNRFDHKMASWLYQMQRLLFLRGHYDTDPATLPDEAASIEAVRTAWLQRGCQHHLNRYAEMMSALSSAFHEHSFAPVPYLFVSIGNGMRHTTPEQERDLLTFLKHMEQDLIEHGDIQGVGFRCVGSV
jgi:ubiquinone/menaquinone biosynthesis C-methylase UbiE